jgi:hypothetical protein
VSDYACRLRDQLSRTGAADGYLSELIDRELRIGILDLLQIRAAGPVRCGCAPRRTICCGGIITRSA